MTASTERSKRDAGVTPDPSDNTTLTDVLASYEEAGYTTQFEVVNGTTIECAACSSQIAAGSFTIESLRRLEGASDPDDMMAVIATECPVCGSQGVLVLGYGPMAAAEHSDVMASLQDGRETPGLAPDATPEEAGET